MTRPSVPGFTINSDAELATLDPTGLPDNTPVLNHNRKAWMLFTEAAANLNTLNGFEAIPQNNTSAYNLTSITIATATYTLDLATTNQYIFITLNVNTTLTITNPGKYTKFFILIDFNNKTIKNLVELFSYQTLFFEARLVQYNFGIALLEAQYINELYAEILHSENVSTLTGLVVTEDLIPYTRPASEIVYFSHYSSVTAYTGAGLSGTSVVGSPIIEKKRLLLSGGRIQGTKTITFNLNEVDFTISFVLARKVLGDFGAIVSSHSAASPGFYIGVDDTSLITAVFGANSLSFLLPDDLKEHVVVINRLGKVYRLFLDGDLVAYVNALNNFNSQSTEPLCIGSLASSLDSPAWAASSFSGYLRDITVNTAATIPYSVSDIYAKDTVGSTVLLLKYNVGTEDLAQHLLTRSFTSNVSVEPFLSDGALNKYTHLGYNDANLEITGDCALEAVLINPSGNTRATIINSTGNFHWGIYDNLLRIDFGAFTLTGTVTLPNDTEFSVAFTKVGTAVKLIVNGVVDASTTTAEVMNGAGSAPEFSIKRLSSQDNSPAAINTTLYPSRSWLIIKQLRVTKANRYNGDYLLPYSYEQ